MEEHNKDLLIEYLEAGGNRRVFVNPNVPFAEIIDDELTELSYIVHPLGMENPYEIRRTTDIILLSEEEVRPFLPKESK